MDEVDAGIIRELSGPDGTYPWNVRQSYSSIGRKLGVDGETVRRRIIHMDKIGLLTGTEVVPNPFVLGREPVRVVLRVANPDRKKREVVSQLRLVDGAVLIINWQGEGVHVLMFCEDELAVHRRVGLMSSISGCKDPVVLRNSPALGFHKSSMDLTRTDLHIVKALRRDPRTSSEKLAKLAGVSRRTVERRLVAMTNAHALFHKVRMDFQKIDGVSGSIIVSFKSEEVKRRLDEKIRGKLTNVFFSISNGSKTSQFNFVCKNVAEFEEIRDW